MAKDTTLMEKFQFDNDDADWSFGGATKTDKTNVAKVVEKVKAGTTIDDDPEEDDDEETTDLEKAGKDDDNEDEDIDDTLSKTKQTPAKKTVEAKKKETPEKKKEDAKDNDSEEDEEEEKFFEDKKEIKQKAGITKEEGKGSGTKDTGKEDEPDEETFYTDLASELKEKGIFEHVEIPKDKVLSEDEFLELHDEEIEARVGESLEAFVEDMPDDGKALIKHLKRGGTVADFVDAYAGSGIDYDKFDATNEAQRDALIRFYVQTVENVEPEDVEDRLQSIKDSGKAEDKAIKWAAKLKAAEDKQKADFEEAEKERVLSKKEANKKFNDSLLDVIGKVNEINTFPISKDLQKKLPSFFTKPTVKVGKDRYIPEFQAKLAEVLNAKNKETREKLVLLGALLQSDFDFSGILPKAETKVVKRANNLLQRSKLGAVKANTAGSYGNRVLADLFDE